MPYRQGTGDPPAAPPKPPVITMYRVLFVVALTLSLGSAFTLVRNSYASSFHLDAHTQWLLGAFSFATLCAAIYIVETKRAADDAKEAAKKKQSQ